MATPGALSLLAISLATLLLAPNAVSQSAPAPTPPGPIDIFAILQKAGQYSYFIRLLNETQVGNQINNQVNNSREGLTVFAPTDKAFQDLPKGTLNNVSDEQKVQLLLYHILPKYYTQESLETVSNPVRTLASGRDGGVFGLNFTGKASQLNVSTGVVEVPIYNAVRKDSPLAVYQVDKVLLPVEFTRATPPASSPPPTEGGAPGGAAAGSGGGGARAPARPDNGNDAKKIGIGLGLMSAIWFLCTSILM